MHTVKDRTGDCASSRRVEESATGRGAPEVPVEPQLQDHDARGPYALRGRPAGNQHEGEDALQHALAARKGVKVLEDNSSRGARALLGHVRADGGSQRFRDPSPSEYQFAVWRAMDEAKGAPVLRDAESGWRPCSSTPAFGRKYWYMLGASTNKKRNLMPSYLLQWEVMRWARQQGATCYDMVAIPSPDSLDESDSLYGVYKFKAGFGVRWRTSSAASTCR